MVKPFIMLDFNKNEFIHICFRTKGKTKKSIKKICKMKNKIL